MNDKLNTNSVELPRWRIDNVYVFVFSAAASLIMATITAVGIYYGLVLQMQEIKGDVKDVKKDLGYITQWTKSHDEETKERAKNYSILSTLVTQINTKLNLHLKIEE